MAKIERKGNPITGRTVTTYEVADIDDMRALAERLQSHPVTLREKIAQAVLAARATLAQRGLLDSDLLDEPTREALDRNGYAHDRMTVHRARIVREFGTDSLEGALAELVWTHEVLDEAKKNLHAALAEDQPSPNKFRVNLDAILELSANLGLLRERLFWRFGVFDESEISPESMALDQVNFVVGRTKKEGPKAVSKQKDRRRQEIVDIIDRLPKIPRHGTGDINFSQCARKVLKEARINAALAHQKGNHVKAGILNEIAGQARRTIIDAIKLAIQNNEIGKTK